MDITKIKEFDDTMQKAKSILVWLPSTLWYSLIWLLSAQPAEQSTVVSDTVTENVLVAGGSDYSGVETAVQASIDELLSFFIRKGAHMFLFFVLAILVWFALVRLIQYRPKRAVVVAVLCILLAASDELHQKMVPGRSGEVRDVLVDIAGILIALLLFTMPALGEWIQNHISRLGILWVGGAVCSGLLLVWIGTMDQLASFFLHRSTQVNFFASMESAERAAMLSSSAPVLRQALYLAACAVVGFINTFLACLSGNRRGVSAALTVSVVLCCAVALLWSGLPLFPGTLLALAAGVVAIVLKKCFPLLRY